MKKVLIITYYWPPAGGPGVQRWLKFVKYLQDFNIEPVVYIPENPNYPIIDEAFVNEIPKGIKIYKHPIFEPYKLASIFFSKKTKRISSGIIQTKNQSSLEKIMLWVRGNLFIPDARKYWVNPSVDYLSGLIQKESIDTIITTGPPHSVHLIGLKLKEKLNVKWISDFRDPWTSIGYHKKLKLTKASQRKHKKLESKVLKAADKVIVTSTTTKNEFKKITDQPIMVITNGFDSDYDGNDRLDVKFSIAHIGSLLTGRNPINLWKVLSGLVNEHKAFKEALRLKFVGVVSDDVLASINEFGLAPYIELVGYVSHEEALSLQRKSQILLLVEIDAAETKGIIPGKVFEYMAAKRPILAIGPKGWDIIQIIQETASGKTFYYSQEDELKKVLLDWFSNYQHKKLMINSTNIDAYSRRELTRKLAAQL
tara:strand:- start:91238 stop:92509 length:1272 start_codon:yes stop_codon:yes gene_type:complete